MMMFLWVVLPILCMVLTAIYIYKKVSGGVECFKPDWSMKKRRIFSVILAAVLIVPAFRIYDTWFIILLHITAFLLMIDIIAIIFRKVHKESGQSEIWHKIYKSGIAAVVLTAIVCGYGRYNMFHVIRIEYTIPIQKQIREEGYKMVVLSDLHYGISLNDDELQEKADRINQENADIVILDGDIVDESTTKEQMESAFRILGNIKSTYGTYYVYGNHHKNNYTNTPNYSLDELKTSINQAGIQILEDSTVQITPDLTLIGRADRSDPDGRKEISELVSDLDPEQAWIVLDHQPSEYEQVEQAGGDLAVSGHTHAGQIWPAGVFARLFHFDDLNYGEKKQGNLTAVVTSGIAGWGYPIRTEKHSEYIVLNLTR